MRVVVAVGIVAASVVGAGAAIDTYYPQWRQGAPAEPVRVVVKLDAPAQRPTDDSRSAAIARAPNPSVPQATISIPAIQSDQPPQPTPEQSQKEGEAESGTVTVTVNAPAPSIEVTPNVAPSNKEAASSLPSGKSREPSLLPPPAMATPALATPALATPSDKTIEVANVQGPASAIRAGESDPDKAIETAKVADQALPSAEPRQAAVAAVRTPDPNRPQQGALSVSRVDYDDEGGVLLQGSASPGSRVRVYLDGAVVGETQADAKGEWQLQPEGVEVGQYQMQAEQIDGAGDTTAQVSLPFAKAGNTGDHSRSDRLVVQPGNNLWRLAEKHYGDGYRYHALYRANRDQIDDPDLIYPGQIFKVPEASATADR